MNKVNYSKQSTAFCLELGRIKCLLGKLGNPDKELNIIHMAGTNGKGSVGSFIETGLIAMGISCGRFQSPHLFEVADSVTVNGIPIEKCALEHYVEALSPLADEVEAELGKAPSPFELLFAAVLLYFKESKCSAVILECGLGGIGDATNAISGASVGVFSTIDLDHMSYLGDTTAKIAENKCGILREGMRVYSAMQSAEAEAVIASKCREKNCSLSFLEEYEQKGMDGLHSIVNIDGENIRLSLGGVFQNINAALAAAVLKNEFNIDKAKLIYTLTHTSNRARLEEIEKDIYFDGAHNVLGVRSLADTINKAKLEGKIIFCIGFMADKDISACLDCLRELENKNFEIYSARVHSNPRSASAEDIAKMAGDKGFRVTCFEDISKAVKKAKCNADIVFAFGSLYMYKELVASNGELI